MSIFDFLTLFGGLAMFLYGMRLMGDGLKESSSGTLKKAMESVTNNPIKAFLLGFGITAIIQSSTATIVITSGLVGAGLLTLHQSIGIIVGANVGTTVTGQIIRLLDLDTGGATSWLQLFKPSSLAPIALIIGIILIMSGKFKNRYDAELYLELLKEVTKRDKAYVTDVALPDSAIEDFVANYKQDPRVVDDVKYNGWETPTGAFVDATFTEEETADLYIVRFSGGINFKAAEQRRDELAEKGFDAYVLKIPGFYIIGAGAFESREEAIALRDEIRQATGRWGTTVQQLELPVSMLG